MMGASGVMMTDAMVASAARDAAREGDIGARDWRSSQSSTNCLGLTLKPVHTFAAARKGAALALELAQADSGQGRGGVDDRGLVVYLMDRDGSVDNRGLDDLLLEDRLNGLVHMVVDMFALDNWRRGLGGDGGGFNALVFQPGTLLLQTEPDSLVTAVVDNTLLDGSNLVNVLLGKHLLGEDGLVRGVVVMLVDLDIDCRLDLAMLGLLDSLLHNGRSDLLVHRGVMVASLVPVQSSIVSMCWIESTT
jgi:hypothetical protein